MARVGNPKPERVPGRRVLDKAREMRDRSLFAEGSIGKRGKEEKEGVGEVPRAASCEACHR